MLRIAADHNILYVSEAFGDAGPVHQYAAEALTRSVCLDHDVLLVRSVTPVNQSLLDATPVSFVGSTTIGTDHVDLDYLRLRSIGFAHAPGANAESVVEYVVCALITLAHERQRSLDGLVLGVVGCGNIGGRLARRASALGMHVLRNDPPLARKGGTDWVDLDCVLAESDVVTVHVPLQADTRHLINASTLKAMKREAWLVNTSRGAVVDSVALGYALEQRSIDAAVLDVWEQEPTPNTDLVRLAAIATPHIAGHSFDGKVSGTLMVQDAVARHFGITLQWDGAAELRPDNRPRLSLTQSSDWMHTLAQQLYDIRADDRRMRAWATLPPSARAAGFAAMRRNYPRRRAFSTIAVSGVPADCRHAVEYGLGAHIQ